MLDRGVASVQDIDVAMMYGAGVSANSVGKSSRKGLTKWFN